MTTTLHPIEQYRKEKENVLAYLNNTVNFIGMEQHLVDKIISDHSADIHRDMKAIGSIPVQIEYLNSDATYLRYHGQGMSREFDLYIDSNPKIPFSLGKHAMLSLSLGFRRVAALNILIEEMHSLSQQDIKDATAVHEANSLMKGLRVQTSRFGDIKFELGTPGDISYSEKTEQRRMHFNGGSNLINYYPWEAKLYVDDTYIDVIMAHGIETVEHQGKHWMVLSAVEIPNHDMSHKGVKLFKSKIFSTKFSDSTWDYPNVPGIGRTCVKLEDKYIAVKQHAASEPTIASGKDPSWALRTMRSRMKRHMQGLMSR